MSLFRKESLDGRKAKIMEAYILLGGVVGTFGAKDKVLWAKAFRMVMNGTGQGKSHMSGVPEGRRQEKISCSNRRVHRRH